MYIYVYICIVQGLERFLRIDIKVIFLLNKVGVKCLRSEKVFCGHVFQSV